MYSLRRQHRVLQRTKGRTGQLQGIRELQQLQRLVDLRRTTHQRKLLKQKLHIDCRSVSKHNWRQPVPCRSLEPPGQALHRSQKAIRRQVLRKPACRAHSSIQETVEMIGTRTAAGAVAVEVVEVAELAEALAAAVAAAMPIAVAEAVVEAVAVAVVVVAAVVGAMVIVMIAVAVVAVVVAAVVADQSMADHTIHQLTAVTSHSRCMKQWRCQTSTPRTLSLSRISACRCTSRVPPCQSTMTTSACSTSTPATPHAPSS